MFSASVRPVSLSVVCLEFGVSEDSDDRVGLGGFGRGGRADAQTPAGRGQTGSGQQSPVADPRHRLSTAPGAHLRLLECTRRALHTDRRTVQGNLSASWNWSKLGKLMMSFVAVAKSGSARFGGGADFEVRESAGKPRTGGKRNIIDHFRNTPG